MGRRSFSTKRRFEVLRRDGFQCAYCGCGPPSVSLEVDHLHPVAHGGTDDAANLVSSCHDCNSGKSGSMLSAKEAARLKWLSEHRSLPAFDHDTIVDERESIEAWWRRNYKRELTDDDRSRLGDCIAFYGAHFTCLAAAWIERREGGPDAVSLKRCFQVCTTWHTVLCNTIWPENPVGYEMCEPDREDAR